jgi:glutathione synthase/RimK-type ligase-like ATP-grasp enzyme
MTRLVLVPHNRGSRAVRDLAAALSTKLGYKVYRVAPNDVKGRIPFEIREGTDKLTQMRRFQDAGVSTPAFTEVRAVAVGWFPDVVVCRTALRGSEGRGIVMAEREDQLVPAPLYTRYFKKKKEFRVHVLNGAVIDVQEKRRRNGVEGGDTRIRNLANGYVFCRDHITPPEGLSELSIRATAALGYSLGAVDIAFNERNNSLVVFEVNANPGLQGTTLENYANAIVAWYKEVRK